MCYTLGNRCIKCDILLLFTLQLFFYIYFCNNCKQIFTPLFKSKCLQLCLQVYTNKGRIFEYHVTQSGHERSSLSLYLFNSYKGCIRITITIYLYNCKVHIYIILHSLKKMNFLYTQVNEKLIFYSLAFFIYFYVNV